MCKSTNQHQRHSFRSRCLLLAAVLTALTALPGAARAATFTWTGASAYPENWYNVTNWSPYGVPAHSDTIIVPSGTAPFPGGAYDDVRLEGGSIGGSLTIAGHGFYRLSK